MEPVFVVFIVFASLVSVILGLRYMRHREKMLELEVSRQHALAQRDQAALPAAERVALAKELLEAYDEAGQDLRTR